MHTVKTLVARAIDACQGNASELGRRLGVSPQRISNYKNGYEVVSPETVAQLCKVVGVRGDEAREYAVLAIIDNPKNAASREVLREVFLALPAAGEESNSTVATPHGATGAADLQTGPSDLTHPRISAGKDRLRVKPDIH